MPGPVITTKMASAGLLFGGLALYHVSTLLDPKIEGYEESLERYGEAMMEVVELRDQTKWASGTALIQISLNTLFILHQCVHLCVTEKQVDKMVEDWQCDSAEAVAFVNKAVKNLAIISRSAFVLMNSDYGEAN